MATIVLRGKSYPILFDLTAVEAIKKRYGTVERVMDCLTQVDEVCWVVALVMTEGQKLQALEYNTTARAFTPQNIATLMTMQDMNNPQVIDAIVEAFNEGLGSEKNLTAEQLTMIGQRMLASPSTLLG